MKKMKVFKYILSWIFSLFGLISTDILNIYKKLIFGDEISTLLSTLIAGLFGFVIAVIPFAIQLLNQENKYIAKLMKKEKFNFFIKPMLYRFINILEQMFYLFIFLILIKTTKNFNFEQFTFLNLEFCNIPIKTLIFTIIFYIYLILITDFFIMLKYIIRDLQTLVYNFIKSKEDNQITSTTKHSSE